MASNGRGISSSNNILSRSQTYKVVSADPAATTAPSFVPYVQNVMNNASSTQIAQFRATYPNMFAGGNPVPVFSYTCYTPYRNAAVPFGRIVQFAGAM